MVKDSPDQVSIEVDDNGVIYYRFAKALWQHVAGPPAYGYGLTPNAHVPAPSVRVAGDGIRVAGEAPPAREPLEDEFASEREDEVARRQVR